MLRIMPLGDSITYDNDLRDCKTPRLIGDRIAYRFHLYVLLKQSGYDFTFVGNRKAGFNYFNESQNAGFPGCTVRQLAELLRTGYNGFEDCYEVKGKYLGLFNPDIILLHIGTNHVEKAVAGDMEDVLQSILEYSDQRERVVTVFLARIIDYAQHNPDVIRYNIAVDDLIKRWDNKTRTLKIIRVDMENALDYAADMADKFHPNETGYKKIAEKWFEAIRRSYVPEINSSAEGMRV
ncbi:MAG: SGNH/GDSL hydrolase family protein [Spirochaetales bacterium]|nr:SGNH/GDSL hydrolase family protein [Spirochaetales bacterium]